LLNNIEHALSTDVLGDTNLVGDVILEIRAGSGGEEAALFAQELLSMYMNYSAQKGWQTTLLSAGDAVLGGIKHAIVEIKGDLCYTLLKFESGVHRVQRVPSTESAGRIHTSAASVVVFPKVDPTDVQIDPSEIEIYTYRSSGPGGQSVNTTDSAVRITHTPSGITVTCQDNKSQIKNREQAMIILKSKVRDVQQQQQDAQLSDTRKMAIKTGDRSDKIRTYNFPQNRVTDHRLSKSWHGIDSIIKGNIDELLIDVSGLSKIHN
jgi:peptide chain release factor 1